MVSITEQINMCSVVSIVADEVVGFSELGGLALVVERQQLGLPQRHGGGGAPVAARRGGAERGHARQRGGRGVARAPLQVVFEL